MSKEFLYYKVLGGKVAEAWDRFFAKRAEQVKARADFRIQYGASGTYGNNSGLVGLVFDAGAPPPAGWKAVRGEPTAFKPHGPGKEFQAIRQKMRSLELDSAEEFQAEVLGKNDPFYFMDGLTVRFMCPETIGDARILCVPKIGSRRHPISEEYGKFSPPDDQTVPLKTSEYYQIKEAHEARSREIAA